MRYAKDVDKLIIDALKEKVNDLCKNGGVTALLQKVKKQRIIKARKGGAYPMQQEENYLAQSISQVDAGARYDEGVKRLLANKSILAVIMKECVPEYRGCTVREIAESISRVNRRLVLSAWMPTKPTEVYRPRSMARTRKM